MQGLERSLYIIFNMAFSPSRVNFRTIVLIALFSQYMSKIDIAVPGYSKERGGCYVGRFPMFKLFPVSISNTNKHTLKTTKLKGNQKYSSYLQGVARTLVDGFK